MPMRGAAKRGNFALAGLVFGAAAASAQQAAPPGQLLANQPLDFDLPSPADTGKPRFFAPRDLLRSPGCTAMLDCRLKVIGALQHNGAVELNGALPKW